MSKFTANELNVLAQNVYSARKRFKKTILVECATKEQAKKAGYVIQANYPDVEKFVWSLDTFLGGYGKLMEYKFKTADQANEALDAIQSAIGQQSDMGHAPTEEEFEKKRKWKWIVIASVVIAVIVTAVLLYPKYKPVLNRLFKRK